MTRTITIRQSLFLSLVFLLLLTSAAIFAVAAFAGIRGAADLTRSVIDATEQRMVVELNRFLGEVERDVLISRDWAEARQLGPADYQQLNALFRPMIERSPQISSVLVSDSDGSEYMLLRDPLEPDQWSNRIVQPERWGDSALIRNRNLTTGILNEFFQELDYDPRERTYYRTALESDSGGVVSWTPPTVFFTTRDPGITAAARWTESDSGATTVIGFDVLLLDLSRITTGATVSKNGLAFIMASGSPEDPPRIVGLPGSETPRSPAELRARLLGDGADLAPDERPDLPLAAELGLDPVARAVAAWEESSRPEGPIRFEVEGSRWWSSFRARSFGSHQMWIAVVAPESDFLGNLGTLGRQVSIAAVLALLGAIILATRMARSYARPLEALARSSNRMRNLELDAPPPLPSRLAEIRDLADEQERMRVALDSFSRYMPVEIVRRLVARGEAAKIGGTRRIITILFTDIEGFTTIAESHSPEEITAHLTDYFELILETIQFHGGEVNQLLGDGVMAYWGAPVENADHARDAVQAIIACQQSLVGQNRKWSAEGQPPLPTRFGLATGEVVVGNVGSPSRLAYAAVGDPANLASRIEGLNRFYGTRLLVDGETRRRAGDAFEWRHVDGVRAKGKTQAVELYEPLGLAGAVESGRLVFRDRYEEALNRYRQRDFRAALDILDAIDAAYHDDRSVARLRNLANEYAAEPPGADWDGATDFQVK